MNLLQLAQWEAKRARERADRERNLADASNTVNIALAARLEHAEALLDTARALIGVAAMAAHPNHPGRRWAAECATFLGRGSE